MEKFLTVIFLFVIVVGSEPSLSAKDNTSLPILVDGLSWTFYNKTCPNLESIVKATLKPIMAENVTQAAGLLRLLFHDCFVQGCDASIMLNGTGSELEDAPNLTIRTEALEIIQTIKDAVEKQCSNVVSCADIIVLATSYAVYLAGGPEFPVPLGRRDSLTFANETVTVDSLPGPTSNVTVLMALFAEKGFSDYSDLVALAGAHTIGIAHCSSFIDRLYPTEDETLSESFAKELYLTCPSNSTVNTTVLDIRTPTLFDNKFYLNLINKQGLLTSDQELYTDSRTKTTVIKYALSKKAFFKKFVENMVKMVQLDVLTGSEGEIREVCSVVNSASTTLHSMVDPEVRSHSSSM